MTRLISSCVSICQGVTSPQLLLPVSRFSKQSAPLQIQRANGLHSGSTARRRAAMSCPCPLMCAALACAAVNYALKIRSPSPWVDDPWYLKFEVEISVVCALFVVYVCLLSLEGIVLSAFAFSQ